MEAQAASDHGQMSFQYACTYWLFHRVEETSRSHSVVGLRKYFGECKINAVIWVHVVVLEFLQELHSQFWILLLSTEADQRIHGIDFGLGNLFVYR